MPAMPLGRAGALALALIAALTFTLAPPATAAEAPAPVHFADAQESVFADEIAWMGTTSISRGWESASGTYFRPFDTVTREQMAAFLYRYAGEPEVDLPARPTFSDVTPQTSDFYAEVEWVAATGIAQGWSDGTFRPRTSITREAMAAFLYRLEEGRSPGGAQVFADSHTSPHADAIEWLATTGISEGWLNWQGRVFKPTATVTREVMAAFLFRLFHGAEPVTAHAPVLEPESYVWFTADRLNLRALPTWSSPIVVTALKHAKGTFDGARDGGWQRVEIGGVAGWAPTEHLRATDPGVDAGDVMVKVDELWLREGPSNSDAVAAKVSRFTRLEFTGVIREDWNQVVYNGRQVWAPRVHFWTAGDKKYVWITADRLNLRTSPTWDSSIAVSGLKGAKGTYLGVTENGWRLVSLGWVNAWAPAEYVTTSDPRASVRRVGIRIDDLWFRSGPSNDHAVVTKAGKGTRGVFTGVIRDEWYQVNINGVSAWAPAVHLNQVKEFNAGEILRKAHSEVGYRSPNWNYNKFNTWAGGTNPWCMIYVMWVFDQIGYEQGVPYKLLYSDWARTALASGVVDTSVTASDLKPGYVVLVDWPPYEGPTHTGIVDHVNSDGTVVLVEGNTVDDTGSMTRGVFVKTRRIVDMYGVFDPDDYARVHGW